MSANDTDRATDGTEAFDRAAAKLSEEAIEALEQIQATVGAAETAADETSDVAAPIVDALSDLSRGDRAGAVQAAMVLFSDDTSGEITEARAACLTALSEADAAADEATDVVDMIAAQADDVADAIDAMDLRERLADPLGL